MRVALLGKPPTVKVRFWACKNCGHEEPATEHLMELAFKWLGPFTSTTTCPNCGARTIQRAFDETFTAGYFLVIKPRNGIRGKVPNGRRSPKTP